jgi:hypothetical protein
MSCIASTIKSFNVFWTALCGAFAALFLDEGFDEFKLKIIFNFVRN